MENGQRVSDLREEDSTTLLFLGTAKGIHLLKRNKASQRWDSLGRTLEEHDISALAWDARKPEIIMAGTASGKLFVSHNKGQTWEAARVDIPDQKIWNITPDPHAAPGAFYLGVDGGHLYYSQAYGSNYHEMSGLRELPDANKWFGPFGPAIFHSVLPVASQPGLIYLGMSVVGILVSQNEGLNWQDTTANIPRVPYFEEGGPELADIHKLALHPKKPTRLYATTHYGTFRSDDGSLSWENITAGLPFEMTRPLALHPHDPDTVYVIAHQDGADNELPIIRGQLTVYRSRNAGQSWEALVTGLPSEIQCAVLREALTIDEGQPCSLYLGTNQGQLFVSPDEGDNWQLAAEVAASIRVVKAGTL